MQACSIFCSPVLHKETIAKAHKLLIEFCTEFQELYGGSKCTINMHLSCHLQKCLHDFGPAHTFWCFGFERMNGEFGAMYTNNHSVEVQLMRRFNNNVQLSAVAQSLGSLPGDFKSAYDMLLNGRKDTRGTVNSNILGHTEALTENNAMNFVLKANGFVEINGATTLQALSELTHRELEVVAGKIFGSCYRRVCRVYSEGTQVSFLGQRYGSLRKCRLLRSATVQAFMYSSSADSAIGIHVHVGYIQRFLTLEIELHDHDTQSNTVENIHFADVTWLDAHPHYNTYPEPLKVWYDLALSRSLIPVAFFTTRVAICKVAIANEEAIVSIPLVCMQHCT